MMHSLFIFLLLFMACTQTSQDNKPYPRGCIAAKCVMENEWINIEKKYTPDHLNESGKSCLYNGSKSAFDNGWNEAIAGLEGISAPKRVALRHIELEYLFMCGPDAYEGCSMSRRLKAAYVSTIYYHQWGEVWIPWMFEQGKGLNSMWMISNNYYPTVIAPGFLFCHTINLIVLKKMLRDDRTAIVFHLAEVLSDMAACIFSFIFPMSFHVFASRCVKVSDHRLLYKDSMRIFREDGFGDIYHLDRQPTWEKMMNGIFGFQSANQLFNLFLVISRWYGLAYTASYLQHNDGKKSVIISIVTVIFCILLALWPGQPIASDLIATDHDVEKEQKETDWTYAWYIYPYLKDSELGKLLIKSKTTVIILLYVIIYISQIVFSSLVLIRYWVYSRSDIKLQNETEDTAKKRKTAEKQKVSLMISTVTVNLICMFPTIIVTFAKVLDWKSGPWLAFFSALQLFASGFNSIGGFITHLIFTTSYRQAFKKAILKPCKKVSNSTHPIQHGQTKRKHTRGVAGANQNAK